MFANACKCLEMLFKVEHFKRIKRRFLGIFMTFYWFGSEKYNLLLNKPSMTFVILAGQLCDADSFLEILHIFKFTGRKTIRIFHSGNNLRPVESSKLLIYVQNLCDLISYFLIKKNHERVKIFRLKSIFEHF